MNTSFKITKIPIKQDNSRFKDLYLLSTSEYVQYYAFLDPQGMVVVQFFDERKSVFCACSMLRDGMVYSGTCRIKKTDVPLLLPPTIRDIASRFLDQIKDDCV